MDQILENPRKNRRDKWECLCRPKPSVCVWACAFLHVCVCVSVFLRVCVCVGACVFLHVCTCVLVCFCVYMCVCLSMALDCRRAGGRVSGGCGGGLPGWGSRPSLLTALVEEDGGMEQ